MDNVIIDLTSKLDKNPPADPEVLQAIVDSLDCNFPPDYLDFMLAHNGAEGEMEESWLRLWPVEELEEGNRDYNGAPDNLPDVLLIGTNGGGDGFDGTLEKRVKMPVRLSESIELKMRLKLLSVNRWVHRSIPVVRTFKIIRYSN
jgi:cell wall assembly regulator SMI1